MIRVVRSELTRLGSPWLLLGGIGLMTLFGILATVVVFVTAGSGSATLPGTQDITKAMLEAPDGMFAGLQTFAGMLGIVALVVWAMSATTDVSSGLIRLLVQAEPRRLRLLGGKIVALAAFTCAATLVATVMVVPMVQGLAQSAGVSTAAWRPHLVQTMATGYLHLTLCVLLWGVVGLCVGILTRSAGISIAIGIGYLLVFEGVLSMLLGSAQKWLPGEAFKAIASGGSANMAFTTALLLGAAYALAALAVAAVTFRRRDITA
jgi:ABC-2 type transport system permease protein